jgi:hypothetical protein
MADLRRAIKMVAENIFGLSLYISIILINKVSVVLNMESTANSTSSKSRGRHAAAVCPHCQKEMTSKNMARHLRLVHGERSMKTEAPQALEQSHESKEIKYESAATNTEDVAVTKEEHITIRQHLDTAKQAIAAVEALLHQKQRALTARIATITPQVPMTY